MNALHHWIWSAPRLCHWTAVWLRISSPARFTIWLLLLLGLVSMALRTVPPATETPTVVEPFASVSFPLIPLPPLSLQALYEVSHDWLKVDIEQQRQQFNLRAQPTWYQLNQFIALLSDTAHSPSQYRFNWAQEPFDVLMHQPMTARIQLSPGHYHDTGNVATLTLPDTISDTALAAASPPIFCSKLNLSGATVQAAWPNRGFIQLQYHDRIERLTLNQLVENAWQLVTIENHQLTFKKVHPEPGCEQRALITVAI